jgi:hypothetical protein
MWEDNIEIDLKEIGCDDMDCNHLAHGVVQWWSLVNKLVNLRFLQAAGSPSVV